MFEITTVLYSRGHAVLVRVGGWPAGLNENIAISSSIEIGVEVVLGNIGF